jgi:hypothetical protein
MCIHGLLMFCAYLGSASYSAYLVKLVLESVVSEKGCALPPIQWSVVLDPVLQMYPGMHFHHPAVR